MIYFLNICVLCITTYNKVIQIYTIFVLKSREMQRNSGKKAKEKKILFTIRMNKDLCEFVATESNKKDRTQAYIVEKALREHFKDKFEKFLQDKASKMSQAPLFPG